MRIKQYCLLRGDEHNPNYFYWKRLIDSLSALCEGEGRNEEINVFYSFSDIGYMWSGFGCASQRLSLQQYDPSGQQTIAAN